MPREDGRAWRIRSFHGTGTCRVTTSRPDGPFGPTSRGRRAAWAGVSARAFRNLRPGLRVTPSMKRPVPALLLLSAFGCASTAPSSQEQGPALVAALTRQADAWDAAIVRKDLPAIAANMSADFRQIRGDGSVVDRDTFLGNITSPDLVIDPYLVEELEVRVHGDVALLSGRTRMSGRFAGEPFTSHYRYVDVYVRRDGRWQVCSVQITPVREPAPGK